MTKTPNAKLLLMSGACAALLSACASEPKPTPPAPAAAPAPAPLPPAAPPAMHETPLKAPAGPRPGSAQDFVVSASDRVYFDYDAYSLRDEGRSALDRQAAWLQRYPAVKVRIEGNCDERGTREYNMALGARRAEAVRVYLASRGVRPERMTTVSFGKERPIDTGTGEDAGAHNRNARTAVLEGGDQ